MPGIGTWPFGRAHAFAASPGRKHGLSGPVSVPARRLAWVEELLVGAEAVPITPAVARVHAELWASLAKEGNVIGQHDLWISATALTHGLGIVTRNERGFARVPGVRVVAL